MNTDDYRVLSVVPVVAPGELSGSDWHCYTIGQGDNRILGYHQGDILSVGEHVRNLVFRLNERRLGGRGRVQLDLATSGSAEG